MTCPDDPAAFLRQAMKHHADHLEPTVPYTESDIGRLKRIIALRDAELECYRMKYPGWVFSPEAMCLYEKDNSISNAMWDQEGDGM